MNITSSILVEMHEVDYRCHVPSLRILLTLHLVVVFTMLTNAIEVFEIVLSARAVFFCFSFVFMANV